MSEIATEDFVTISVADQERIGKALFEKMEQLDPETKRDWSEITDREKDYFWLCAEAVLSEADLLLGQMRNR